MQYHEAKNYARKLRLNPTKAEKELWTHIRQRQLDGKKFLRQHPIFIKVLTGESFYFIPDFFCYEAKLAIELDGSVHRFLKDRDANRDAILADQGIKVLRVSNGELNNIESVLEKIKNSFPED